MRVRLTQAQARFLDSTAHYRGFVGGRGAGKSFVGAYDLIKRARTNRTYMVIAPTYPMLRDATLRTLKNQLRTLNRPFTEAKSDGVITLSNNATLLLRTANEPDRLRGPNLSGIWGDEGSLYDEEVFDIAIASLREGGEQGWMSLTFTPKGKAHWTYKRLVGERTDGTASELVHSHSRENPFLPPNFVDTITRQYGAGLLAQQELGGEFLDMGDTEWPASYFERPDFFYTADPKDARLRVAFYDGAGSPGSKIGDWHACSILSVTGDGHLWFDNRLWRGSQDQAADMLISICCEPGRLDACGIETNFGGDIMIPLLGYTAQKYKRPDLVGKWFGVPHVLKKEQRIRRLGTYLASGTIHVKDGPAGRETLRQGEQFPLCDHDDAWDAMDGARELASRLLSSA